MQPEVDIQAMHIKMSYHYGKSSCEIICKVPVDLECRPFGSEITEQKQRENKEKRKRKKERKEGKGTALAVFLGHISTGTHSELTILCSGVSKTSQV